MGGHREHRLALLVHAGEVGRDDGGPRARLRQALARDAGGVGDGVARVDRPQPLEVLEAGRGAEADLRVAGVIVGHVEPHEDGARLPAGRHQRPVDALGGLRLAHMEALRHARRRPRCCGGASTSGVVTRPAGSFGTRGTR